MTTARTDPSIGTPREAVVIASSDRLGGFRLRHPPLRLTTRISHRRGAKAAPTLYGKSY
jgi:hypothetical protein